MINLRARCACLSLVVLSGACSSAEVTGAAAANAGGNVGTGGDVGDGGTGNTDSTTVVAGGTTSDASSLTTGGAGNAGGASVVGGSAPTGGSRATGGSAPAAGSTGISGLRVVGNTLQDDQGRTIKIHGVNHSGTESQCTSPNSNTIFDPLPGGLTVDGSMTQMTAWKINAVRIPLNEDCWLGINGISATVAGTKYQTAISNYVTSLHSHNIIPILELHWAAPGTVKATAQQPMPDADHTPTFWTSVAQTFIADTGVIFELYNEPYPNGNSNNVDAWTCWRDGCTETLNSSTGSGTYQAVGMQSLVNTIRAVPSNNVILLGGVQYSNGLNSWDAYKPTDKANNFAAAWHIYNYNPCMTTSCFAGAPATLAAKTPVVATEFGEDDCSGAIVGPWMTWFDSNIAGYLAWTWNTWSKTCVAADQTSHSGGNPWSLITSYSTASPMAGLGQTVHDHYATF